MNAPLRILLLEDNPADAELIEYTLRKSGLVFESRRVERRDEFIAALSEFQPDLVLADYHLPEFDGMAALALARNLVPGTPYIFVTGAMGEETAVESLHQGASDYILKDRLTRLPEATRHALAEAQDKRQLRQTEQALVESETRFRNLVETTTDWIWETDVQGRYTYASPAVWPLLGYTAEEIIGRTPFELMPQAEAAWVGQRFGEFAAARQAIIQLENVCLHRDGHTVILETSAVPVFTPDGAYAGYRGIDRDITKRKQAVSALRDSELKFRLLSENAADCIFWTAPNGRFLYVSPACKTISGYEPEDFLDDPTLMARLVHPDDLSAYQAHLHNLSEVDAENLEYRIIHRDGSLRWVSHHCRAIYDAEGLFLGRRGSNSDITARKRDRDRLASQARLALALLELPHAAEQLDEATFMQRGQELAEDLTGSQIAFIHLVHDDQESIELVAWSRRTLEHYCHATYNQHYPVSQAGIWADALRQRAPVVVNDYANTPNKHGLPEGHATLNRLITVPVIEGGLVRMLAGVGNKATEYTDQDVETVQLLANEIWHIVRQRRTDQALRDNEARLSSILRTTPVSIGVVSNRVFAEVNQTLLRLSGYSREELIGQSSRLLFESDAEFERVGNEKSAQIHEHDISSMETRIRCKNGELRDIFLSSALTDPNDPSKGETFSALDITDRKHAEEHLRKLAQAVEQSPESIVITDLNANLEYVNETFLCNTGYSREEALGKNPRILHSGKTPKATYAALWEAMNHGRPWQGEFINRRKDGSEYVEFAIITPLRQADGSVTHYVAVKEDITEKKHNAIELDQHRLHLEDLVASRTLELSVAQQNAERLARVKSEFLANMSHEIRTPLNAVLGFAQIGQRDGQSPHDRTTFGRILDSGQLLLRVVNDILDFSKIEAGKLAIEKGRLHPGAVLDRCADLVRDTALNKGLEFHVEEAAALPASCQGDELRVTQVLMNLLTNAIKFTQHGNVTLSAGRMKNDAGEFLLLRVTDSGIGMSKEELARLFLPFEQADSSTTRRFGGTGLGLAISKRLLDLMGGSIVVNSQPGQGSIFEVHLPLLNPEGLAASRARGGDSNAITASTQQLRGLTILVAEDNEVNRMVLEELLAKQGCQLVQVENGRLAVDQVRSQGAEAFDLVLMDIQMPVLDGIAATREIRAFAADLPIIGLTAHALAEERDNCLAAGMVDHVAKPIVLSDLLQAIRNHVKSMPEMPPLGHAVAPAIDAPSPDNTSFIDWPTLEFQYRDNRAFFDRLLATIVESNRDRPGAIQTAIEKQDFVQLAFLTHSLKGMAGDVLPGQLRDLAGLTETAARQADAAAFGHATTLAAGLLTFLAEVTAYLERTALAVEATSEEASTFDAAEVDAVLAHLKVLLIKSDTAANTYQSQSAALLRRAFGAEADQLGREIQGFDYEAALTRLQTWQQRSDAGDVKVGQ